MNRDALYDQISEQKYSNILFLLSQPDTCFATLQKMGVDVDEMLEQIVIALFSLSKDAACAKINDLILPYVCKAADIETEKEMESL